MSSRPLKIDVGIAVVAAVLLLIVAPGLAVVGLIAVLVLAVCGLSFAFERLRRRRRPPTRRPPPRRL